MLISECNSFAHLLQANQRNLREEKHLQTNLKTLERERRTVLQVCRKKEQLARDHLQIAHRGHRLILQPLMPTNVSTTTLKCRRNTYEQTDPGDGNSLPVTRISSLIGEIPFINGILTTGQLVPRINKALPGKDTNKKSESEDTSQNEEDEIDNNDLWNAGGIIEKMIQDEKVARQKFRRNLQVF